ncbi:MAG: FxLYD domain-containing protein [Chloroflexi bacterium]|nr:FxLYD domain-containing protein [Chloroflexota bacterium]
MKRFVSLIGMFFALSLFAGCGQVMTRVTPTPTATPTVGLSPVATLRPTATPAPYTPAPTATPTVTPTPIIYKIEPGDTLLAIAIKFGISTEGLQDTNGITDPRSLQIGQELIIPREELLKVAGTPTATPTALPFTVENVTFNFTPFGGLWCFGEIHNTTGQDLEQAAVTISLLDAGGKVVAQAQEHAQVDLLGPGDRAPFAAHINAAPASFASYLVVPWLGVRGYVGSYYRDLETRNTHGSGERYAAYTVTGIVANTGPEDAIGVVVTVTLYDALGRVVGTRRGVPEHNVIPRGGETTFSLQLTPAGGPVASFHVQALGRRQLTPTPTPR